MPDRTTDAVVRRERFVRDGRIDAVVVEQWSGGVVERSRNAVDLSDHVGGSFGDVRRLHEGETRPHERHLSSAVRFVLAKRLQCPATPFRLPDVQCVPSEMSPYGDGPDGRRDLPRRREAPSNSVPQLRHLH